MSKELFFVLITAVLFTTHEPVSKLIANDINPYAITAIRFFGGSLVCLPLSVREVIRNKIKLNGKDFLILGGLGVLDICVSMVLLQIGVKMADSPALISIIFSSNSIITIILSAIFLKSKLTKVKIVGIVLCVVGVLVSVDIGSGSNAGSIIFAILAAATFSVYTVLCKKYMYRFSGVIQTGISFFLGSSVLLIILFLGGVDIVGGISGTNITEVMYLSVVVTGIGYLAYFAAIKSGGPQIAAITFLIKPILTPFVTWVVNGIVPSYSIIIAVILVVIGAALSGGALRNNRKNPEKSSM